MQGKLQILSSILKLDKPFRPPHIVDVTGLDRQLVRYHLDKFREQGYIEKIDKYYVIKDREGLLNSLIESTDKLETALPKAGGFFKSVTGFNHKAETIIAAKSLKLPMYESARDAVVRDIDDSIKILKQMRKYMYNATKTDNSAKRFFKDFDPEQVWKTLVEGHDATVDLPDFEKAYWQALRGAE